MWGRAGYLMDLLAHLLETEFELGELAYGCQIRTYRGVVGEKGFVRLGVV